LTLWYVAVFSAIFGALAVFLVVNLRSTMETNADESLELTYRAVYDRLQAGGTDLTTILHEAVIPGEAGQPEVIGQILDGDGRVLDSSGQPAVADAVVGADVLALTARDGHWHGSVRLLARDHDDTVIAVRMAGGEAEFLVLAQTLAPVTEAVHHLIWLLLVSAPIALLVAGAGGWAVARVALKPVDVMTRTAAAIDAADHRQLLPVPSSNDELSRLATTLNDMVDRLGRALEAERRFSADASHELRTPLGVLEAELDVAIRSAKTPPEASEVLRSMREEVTGLGRIVNNLLLLSRTEAVGMRLDRRPDDLLDIVLAVTARFRGRADSRGVELRVTGGPARVAVDPELLAQAVSNLVDNALTHTDRGGSVVVTVSDGEHAVVSVADTGEGISADELARIFDRFYRVDRARDRNRGGSGLGLEITRRIVEAHGGHIGVVSERGKGSTFTIPLPPGGGSEQAAQGDTARAR
jgi:heavy metal sensor kinase